MVKSTKMRDSSNRKLSLKGQLIFYFSSVILIVGFTFSLFYYNSSTRQILENVGEREYLLVSSRMEIIDNELYQLNSFIDWICLNNDIKEVLQRGSDSVAVFDTVKKRAYENIQNRYMFFTLKNWISSMYIIGDNGLTIRYGSNAYNVDVSMFENDLWYLRGCRTMGETVYSYSIPNHNRIPTCLRASPAEYVIPVFKYIKYDYNSSPLGKLVILLDSEIFVKNGEYEDPLSVNLLIDPQGIIIGSSNPELAGKNISSESYYINVQNINDHFSVQKINNIKQLVTYKKSKTTGYAYMTIQPVEQVTHQGKTVRNSGMLIIVLPILFAFLLSWYLSVNFTKPINSIAKRVNEIAKGNFSTGTASVSPIMSNEVASLENDLHDMELGIQKLIKDNIRRADEKRLLEIKMLQSQINPHFLNNTLNSIRLMATLQGADGIVEMISSLAVIIDSCTRNTAEKITIREELSVLNSYFTIQRIRYKGKVKFSIRYADESILDCMILKFVLQPIVENAIFHGIEPKSSAGSIDINLEYKGGNICITIKDDGLGIEKDKLEKILEFPDQENESSKLHNIGLHNVHKRLRYVYGEAYGLNIESEKDHFTIVSITIPAQKA